MTYGYRGAVNLQLSQFEAALADFDEAVIQQSESDPKSQHDALVGRAAVKFKSGDFQGATAHLQSAHAVSPLSDLEQHAYEQCLKQLADDAQVIEQSTNISEDLSDTEALYRQAHAMRGKGDIVGALSALENAIRLQPQDVRLYQERAGVQMGMHKYEEALQDLQTVMAIDSSWDIVNVLKMCAVCKAKLNHLQDAAADLDKALAIRPFDEEVLMERAAMRFNQHDNKGALADANTVVKRGVVSNKAFTIRGAILCMSGLLHAA